MIQDFSPRAVIGELVQRTGSPRDVVGEDQSGRVITAVPAHEHEGRGCDRVAVGASAMRREFRTMIAMWLTGATVCDRGPVFPSAPVRSQPAAAGRAPRTWCGESAR